MRHSMTNQRFCEACGARLAEDARYCEACGHRVAEPAAATGVSSLPAAVAAGAPSHEAPIEPARSPRSRVLGGLIALAGAAALALLAWLAFEKSSAPLTGSTTPPDSTAVQAPAADQTSAGAVAPASEATPTVTLEQLNLLKEAVVVANRAQTEAVFANSPDVGRLSDALMEAIDRLGGAIYRYYVIDQHGTLALAQSEMATFLRDVNWQGLGLSEDTIKFGVAHVSP
jgi:hypothetical protein